MRLRSMFKHGRGELAALGLFGLLFVGCSEATTGPIAEGESQPGLAATALTLGGRLSLGSHTNLLDEYGEDDFEGPVPFAGAVVRLKKANGSLIQTGTTSSTGSFQLQASSVPARLEFVLTDGSTYTFALGSVEAGTTVIHSKLEHDGAQRVMNAEVFPDDDLDAVKDDGMATRVVGRIADDPASGVETTTAREQIDAVAAELDSIVASQPGTKLADKIEDVLEKTRDAARELAKDPADMEGALGKLEGAVGDLEVAMKDRLLDDITGARLMDQLAVVARQSATETLDHAINPGRHPDKIAQAQNALAAADQLRMIGRSKDAMSKYKDALSQARSALS